MAFFFPLRLAGVLSLAITVGACSVGGNSDGDGGPQSPSVDAADSYIELGPIADANVQVKTLGGSLIGEGMSTGYDESRDTVLVGSERRLQNIEQGRRTGLVRYSRLDFSGLADNDMVIVSATGGRDIDPDDDGILVADEGSTGPQLTGTVSALVKVADLRSGVLFITPLTTVASAAASKSTSAVAIAERASRLATFLLKSATTGGDLNGDKLVDWRDLYYYDPTQHEFTDAGSDRAMDAAVITPEILDLFLSTATSSNAVAHQLIAGGSDNTASAVAIRLFGDIDSDGLANVFEDPNTNDSDKDSVVDARDTDLDGDGLANDVEPGLGLIPWNPDTDHDKVKDGQEDRDGDGLDNATEITKTTDPKKSDTDDDGLTDKQEIDSGLDPNNAQDGAAADSDGDGISNAAELAHGLNPKDASDATQDPDADGLSNHDEILSSQTDMRKADTDGDGINDGSEVANSLNPLDPSDGGTTDTDGDGLTNAVEIANGLNPKDGTDADKDGDGDGLSSREEITTYGTKPTVADTDGDGLKDGDEINVYHTKATIADSDADGLLDGREVTVFGTDPLNPDTDGDSIPDGTEANGFVLYDRVTKISTDPTRADTDSDGIHDGIEKAVQDQFASYVSVGAAKNFLLGPLHPNNAASKPDLGGLSFADTTLRADSLEQDPDGDGKPTLEELFHGSNPNNSGSSFTYVYETTSGGPRTAKFVAMDAANFAYVPGNWDVDGDGTIDPGFFIARFEAKSGTTTISGAPTTADLLEGSTVYNANSKRFVDRLCNNDSGGEGVDGDITDSAGACRGNQYASSLVGQSGPALTTVVFKSDGTPLTGLTWVEAKYILRSSPADAVGASGGPYVVRLPTETQWVLLARMALSNPANWTSGKVGDGKIYQGHSDNSPASALSISDDSNPYDGTGNSASSGVEQRRTLIIANGMATRDFDLPLNYKVTIWDLSGNVSEWTSGIISARSTTSTTAGRSGGDRFAGGRADFEDYTGGNLTGTVGDITSMPSWWKPKLANGTIIGSASGAGAYFDGASESDSDGDGQSNGAFATIDYGYGTAYRESYSALVRGGYFASATYAGILAASVDNGIGRRATSIGFRGAIEK